MNFVFKIAGRSVGQVVLLFAIVAVFLPCPARAQAVYFGTRELLGDFFRHSQAVTYRRIELSEADRARVKARLGYDLKKPSYTFFIAQTNGKVDGYAIIDEENGEHLPITFAVKIAPSGVVERQEIVVYREARGDEVRDAAFRQQFVGKSADDPICPEHDIAVVSGATISSRAMSIGVKRALVLFEMFVRPGALASRPLTASGTASGTGTAPGKL
jgi:hypothetical protein